MKFVPHDYQKFAIEYIKEHRISAVLLDMGDGAPHLLDTLSIPVEQRGRRLRRGGQRVVLTVGVEVGADGTLGVIAAVFVPVFRVVVVVSMEQRHTLVVVAGGQPPV